MIQLLRVAVMSNPQPQLSSTALLKPNSIIATSDKTEADAIASLDPLYWNDSRQLLLNYYSHNYIDDSVLIQMFLFLFVCVCVRVKCNNLPYLKIMSTIFLLILRLPNKCRHIFPFVFCPSNPATYRGHRVILPYFGFIDIAIQMFQPI